MLHVRLEESGEEMEARCTNMIARPAAAVLYKLDRTVHSDTYPTADSELGRLMGKRYITVSTTGTPLPYTFGIYHDSILVLTRTSARTGATTCSVYRPVIGAQTDRWYEDLFHPDADAPVLD